MSPSELANVASSLITTFQLADNLAHKNECVCIKLLAIEQYRKSVLGGRPDKDINALLDTLKDQVLKQMV
jgi:hypothetical protein